MRVYEICKVPKARAKVIAEGMADIVAKMNDDGSITREQIQAMHDLATNYNEELLIIASGAVAALVLSKQVQGLYK